MIMVLRIILFLNVETMGIIIHEPRNKSLVIWNSLLKYFNLSMKKVAVCPFYVSFSSMELPLILLLLVQVGSQINTGGWGRARPLSRGGESVGLGRGVGGVPVWSCVGWRAEIEEMVKKEMTARTWWLMTDTAEKTHTHTHAYTNKEH